MADNRKHSLAMGGRKPGLRGKLPVLSTTGPISIWMIIFVMLPLIYVLVNLLVDLLHAAADPRVRNRFVIESAKGGRRHGKA